MKKSISTIEDRIDALLDWLFCFWGFHDWSESAENLDGLEIKERTCHYCKRYEFYSKGKWRYRGERK